MVTRRAEARPTTGASRPQGHAQVAAAGLRVNLGSWAALMCIFGGAYTVAWFFRRQWR
jgi:hypothetical protein